MRKLIVIALRCGARSSPPSACSSATTTTPAATPAAEAAICGVASRPKLRTPAEAVTSPSRPRAAARALGRAQQVVQTASLALSVPRERVRRHDPAGPHDRDRRGRLRRQLERVAGEDRQRLVRGSHRRPRPRARLRDRARPRSSRSGRRERAGDPTDVTAEYVDLQSRIRHLEAVERQLLGLLEQAETVSSALAVQSEAQRVQLQLEQARGRLRYLEDQVAYATISLELGERGPRRPRRRRRAWGIVDAWRDGAAGLRHGGRLDLRRRGHDRAASSCSSLSRLRRRLAGARCRSPASARLRRASRRARVGIVQATNRREGRMAKKKKAKETDTGAGPAVASAGEDAVHAPRRGAGQERARHRGARQGRVREGQGRREGAKRALGQVGLAAADEIKDLRKHIERLEKRLAKLEADAPSPAPKPSRQRRSPGRDEAARAKAVTAAPKPSRPTATRPAPKKPAG